MREVDRPVPVLRGSGSSTGSCAASARIRARTRPAGPRPGAQRVRNDEIDLIQIYGLNAGRHPTSCARTRAACLQSQTLNGEEYPPYLYDGDRKRFDPGDRGPGGADPADEQRRQLFAFGSDTGNLQLGFVLMGVLFLREHNRIARSLPPASTPAGTTSGCSRPRGTSSP